MSSKNKRIITIFYLSKIKPQNIHSLAQLDDFFWTPYRSIIQTKKKHILKMDYFSLKHCPDSLCDSTNYATLFFCDFLPNGKCNFRRRFLNSPSMLDESVEWLSSPPPVAVPVAADAALAAIPLLVSCWCCSCCVAVVETMDDEVDSKDSRSVLWDRLRLSKWKLNSSHRRKQV